MTTILTLKTDEFNDGFMDFLFVHWFIVGGIHAIHMFGFYFYPLIIIWSDRNIHDTQIQIKYLFTLKINLFVYFVCVCVYAFFASMIKVKRKFIFFSHSFLAKLFCWSFDGRWIGWTSIDALMCVKLQGSRYTSQCFRTNSIFILKFTALQIRPFLRMHNTRVSDI